MFINAFVDLGHKIIIQSVIFKTYTGQDLIIYTAIINSLILWPFLLLFTTSGFLSDKYSKPQIMKVSALAAIIITLGITYCYYNGWYQTAFFMTFILAIQSAIYGPAKYGYLKEFLGKEELSKGNGWVQSVTIVAILSGTVVFSNLFEQGLSGNSFTGPEDLLPHIAYLGWIFVGLSIIEFGLCFVLPKIRETNVNLKLDKNKFFKGIYLVNNLREIFSNSKLWVPMLALSVFWAVSQLLIATFPAHAKNTLGILDASKVQEILALSIIGIIIGSIIPSINSINRVRSEYILIGSIGIILSLFILPSLSNITTISICFLVFVISAGLIIVPLNVSMQLASDEDKLATVLAGYSWLEKLAMMLMLFTTIALAHYGINSVGILYFAAILSLLGLTYASIKYFGLKRRIIVILLTFLRYDISAIQSANVPKTGGVLVAGNHVSFLDWLLVQIVLERPIQFIMDDSYYRSKIGKFIFDFFKVIPIRLKHSKDAILQANQALANGGVVCIFPEGEITSSESMSSVKSGYQRIVEGTNAKIVPFYIYGMSGSRFSRIKTDKTSWLRRKVRLSFGKNVPLDISTEDLKIKIESCQFLSED